LFIKESTAVALSGANWKWKTGLVWKWLWTELLHCSSSFGTLFCSKGMWQNSAVLQNKSKRVIRKDWKSVETGSVGGFFQRIASFLLFLVAKFKSERGFKERVPKR
jgi:hypothetical protein